jgi:sugar/nucleoside kinase (ribokinase family)
VVDEDRGQATAQADPHLVIIGDIRLEFRARLSSGTFREISRSRLDYTPVNAEVAGTAANMAKHAARLFGTVDVIAKLGDDQFTEHITRFFSALGVSLHAIIDTASQNGLSIVVRDNSPDWPGGLRLLMAGPSPNTKLAAEEIALLSSSVAEADLLFTDGYSLLAEPSREAVREAIRIKRGSVGRACLDAVPHDIDRYLELEMIRDVASEVDIVIAGYRTACALAAWRHPPPSPAGDDLARLASALTRTVSSRVLWFIRHGPAQISRTAVCQGGSIVSEYAHVRPPMIEPTGFGDRIASAELCHLARHGVPPQTLTPESLFGGSERASVPGDVSSRMAH